MCRTQAVVMSTVVTWVHVGRGLRPFNSVTAVAECLLPFSTEGTALGSDMH